MDTPSRAANRPESRRRASWWAVFCLVAGAVGTTWWLSGLHLSHGPDHMVGPYTLPPALEYGAGVVAVASGIAAALATAVRPPAAAGLSPRALVMLMTATIVATASWRVITAGGDGANIGGGLVAMVAPFAVAALLFATVTAERSSRNGAMRHYPLFAALALATGPALCAIILVLVR